MRQIDPAVDIDPGYMDALRARSRAKDCANPRLAKLAGPNAIDLEPALTPAVAPVKFSRLKMHKVMRPDNPRLQQIVCDPTELNASRFAVPSPSA